MYSEYLRKVFAITPTVSAILAGAIVVAVVDDAGGVGFVAAAADSSCRSKRFMFNKS